MSRAVVKIAASANLLIGIVWMLGVTFFLLTMAGISTPISLRALLFAVVVWGAGPVLLVYGSVSSLIGKFQRVSIGSSVTAAVALSFIAACAVRDFIHPQGWETDSYAFSLALTLLAILCDVFTGILVVHWKHALRIVGVK